MRILLLADAPSIHTRRWAQRLNELGHEIHIASLREYNIEGARFHHLRIPSWGKLGYFAAIPQILDLVRRLRPDVIHAHYATSYGLLAALAGLRPLVVTAWGTDVLVSPFKSRLSRWSLRFVAHHAEEFIVVASHMKDAMEQLGIKRSSIRIIPFGVDLRSFAFVEKDPDREGPPIIVSTRALEPAYDIATLIRAFAELMLNVPAARLNIVGMGSQEAELRELSDSLGVSESVVFCGRVKLDELKRLISSADIFVSSSLSDGNNIPLNEAMALGTYVVASDIEANRQWIVNGTNGRLFSPGDPQALSDALKASMKVCRNPSILLDNRKRMEADADWLSNVDRVVELYRSCSS